jgi:hypothetical protein
MTPLVIALIVAAATFACASVGIITGLVQSRNQRKRRIERYRSHEKCRGN